MIHVVHIIHNELSKIRHEAKTFVYVDDFFRENGYLEHNAKYQMPEN